MSKSVFVKIVTDPDVDLSKCIVGLACAAQAIEDGHKVSVFFAANGVKLLQRTYFKMLEDTLPLPEEMLSKMMNKITDQSSNLFVSTGSHAANGVTKENADELLLEGYSEWMTWSGPPGVIQLAVASDVQLVY